jgi:hypothetical protein
MSSDHSKMELLERFRSGKLPEAKLEESSVPEASEPALGNIKFEWNMDETIRRMNVASEGRNFTVEFFYAADKLVREIRLVER